MSHEHDNLFDGIDPPNVTVVSDHGSRCNYDPRAAPDRRAGVLPVSYSGKQQNGSGSAFYVTIKTRQLAAMTRQLATLLRAGMPLVPALKAMSEQLSDHPLGEIVNGIAEKVNTGDTFADALRQHPNIFSDLYVNTVDAAQSSGTLEATLIRLADMLEQRAQIVTKVKAALVYPITMAIVAVGVVIFLVAFVIPSITAIFVDMNRSLPLPTTILIAISSFMRQYLLVIALSVVAAIAFVCKYLNTEKGGLYWDRAKLKLPRIGDLLTKVETARFTKTLAVLLSSGVPILQAIDIVMNIVQNRYIVGAVAKARDAIEHGSSVAQAFRNTNVFPPIVIHMIATGEISGDLENSLNDVADTYDSEIQIATRTLTAMLEPAIMLAMGVVIGFIVLAILLPIFEINQAV